MMMKELYKLSLTVFVLLLSTSLALAQERSISGTVSDETGQPLPGVNILVKGTSLGTVSDANGSFTIGVNDDAILVFSFIGYKAKEVAVGTQSTIKIGMEADATSLQEVVVVGYGEQRKSLVTGAISSVKADELKTVSVGSIDQAMQGRTAGVNMAPNSGQPGSGTKIRIRGIGSNGNSNPLFIIDGVRTSTDGMDYLNPSDIASIEILKDAASAAIYGAEGANGVVIVTTKKGKANTSEISYNGQYAVQSLRQDAIPLMNASQYQLYLKEAGFNAIPNANGISDIPTDAEVAADPVGTDWQEVGFQSAPIQNHTINFSGGTEKSTLFVSAGYFGQKGIAGGDKSKFDRYSLRVNSNHKLKDWLNVGENFAYTNRNSASLADNTEFGGTISSILSLPPSTPAYFNGALPGYFVNALADESGGPYNVTTADDGRIYGLSKWLTGEYGNPLSIYKNSHGGTTQNKVLGNVFLEISPIKDLKFTTRVGVDAAFQKTNSWTPNYWYSTENKNAVARGRQDWDQWFTAQWENFATYTRTFVDHNLGLTLGHAMQKYQHQNIIGTYAGMFKEQDNWQFPDYIPDADDKVGGSQQVTSLLSFFGRLSYDYKDKYLLEASVRRDASSLLAEGHQVGIFPAVSVGWVLSNEDFFQNTSNVLSYFKLRGSFGQNGSLSNLTVGGWRNSISTNIRGPIRYLSDDGTYLVGAAPTQAANPNLTWETSEQLDVGADLRFLNDKLTFTVDYFKKTTKDLIAPGNPPLVVGIGIPFINTGTVQNKGFEFELGYRSTIGSSGFKYDISGNFTSIKNEVVELYKGATPPPPGNVGTHWGNATRFVEGEPIWSIYGYKTAGIFQNQDQIEQYLEANQIPISNYNPEPGDAIIVDVNGDHQINTSDYTKIGNPHPTFYYGGRINLSFKNFDLMVFAQGQGGNDIVMGFFRTDRGTANKPEFFFKDRWTGEGSTNSWFRASTTGTAYSSDMMLMKGNFTKIRQLQLGYTLPGSVTEKMKVKNVRVYVSLDNYFVFTKYKGFDPEIGSSAYNTVGIDRGTYPFPRKVVGGLSFTF
jgi:TonB-dependent starch-binding outer membrane protein SusC